MGIFWNTKNKGDLALVFDIRSCSVGAALFLTKKNGIPKIIFSIREPIPMEENVETDKFLSSMIKALERAAKTVENARMGAPKRIFCVLASPLHFSQTRVIRLEKNAPFIFTAKLANDLIQKEISLFEEEHSLKYSNAGSKLRSIEFKNIKTMLNGYEASNPLDQKAKDLEMSIFISMSGESVLQKIEETICKHFNQRKITFSSSLMASFAVVRDMYMHNENFLLTEIGGEVTDISMIKKNILRESISFPLGFNSIVRGLAARSNSSFGEAKSLISLLKDEHASSAVAKNSGPVIDDLKKEWLLKFQESLSHLSNDISIPATIYLVVNGEMSGFFSETIKGEQFNQYTLTESKFTVVFLGAEVFHGMAVFGENVVRDATLVVDAIYVNRFLIHSLPPEKI
ncbi:hypothetical protein A2738_01905 [Candidatus Nomurabacteria bacterium RIFCSPHIGHO2_01_FULL_42_15]|uniref:SHS2 domain-containing protein n=1 Tax=Candidatus Nomurabacteria bacterium RIFCSPHIGHO2_01_FULL_42_15 TaxID=1801742 RepID=A0A1F6VG39_9BACT|nr:MAG: hypothetical protein A2738_01905 [Candidatus Nomurabacteria bacterium RIFCSPHIGHO2_01_FULL_42_15]OGI92961.1 MAG: hypothetical protein A3A99_00265 [Candidatus Nomurabacteria bacterium RIFCSPLOWO2_01_FULL_41_18]